MLVLLVQFASAQQDPMFTKYMFNSLVFNPAYAGSQGYMSARLLHRGQWIQGIDGAPTTQSLTLHSPLNEKIGLGLSIINDAIGPTNTMTANAAYAYHIPFKKGKLSVAIQGGGMYWRANWNKLKAKDPNDHFEEDPTPTLFLPNFGAGLYYYTDKYYLGFSVPHLINYDMNKMGADRDQSIKSAKLYRHYYFTAGAAFPINPAIVFKPSILVKNIGFFGEFNPSDNLDRPGAPTEIDIDASFFLYETLWVGASFRSAIGAFYNEDDPRRSSFDSADLWMSYYLKNGLRIGAAYDFPLNKLQPSTVGSFEVMLGFDFAFKLDKIVTPRYF